MKMKSYLNLIMSRFGKTLDETPTSEPTGLRAMPGCVPRLSVPRVRKAADQQPINTITPDALRFRYPFPPPTTRLIKKQL